MYKDLRVLFVGIPDMAYVCLDGLYNAGVKIVGVIGAKKTHNTYYAFKTYAINKGLRYIDYDNLTDESFINEIKSLNADVAVVCSFNYKVPKVMLDSVKGGFINVHPALLPDYRGPNPYSSVILNNEEYTGVTLHMMDEEFDTGDIVLQKKIPVLKNETMGTLFNKLNALGLDMLIEALQLFSEGKLTRTKQPTGTFKYASRVETSVIDFNKSAEEIERFVRALNPYIISKTYFRGIPLSVFSADVVEDNTDKNIPCGTIVKIDDEFIYIKTSKGLIVPTAIQFGGFLVSSSKDFVSLVMPKVGEMLKGDIFG